MAPQLTQGCLASIMTGAVIENPVLQILGTRSIVGQGNCERFRLLVSDGKYFQSYAMLATQLNSKHANGELADFTVVRIDRYITSMIGGGSSSSTGKNDKRVLIILGLTVLTPGPEVGEKIGSPVTLPDNLEGMAGGGPHSSGTAITHSASAGGGGGGASGGGIGKSQAGAAQQMMNSTMLGEHLTHPIASLSPYQNKWVIKARVTNKSNVRTWSNSRGEGKLFSMDLLDESGEIRATAFKDQCDKYYDMIEVDKVYYISKCQLKQANKQFTSIKNDYEMTFTNDTMVTECVADDGIPTVTYDFVPIKAIAEKETGATVDLIAVCKDASNVVQLTSKAGRELRKREVNLVDPSGAAISLTLWGNDADTFDGSLQPVVVIKGARVNEYGGGKSLSMFSGSTLKINPDITEAHKLRGWFDNGGSAADTTSLSAMSGAGGAGGGGFNTEWMTFREAKQRQLGNGDKPDYFMCKATVHLVRSSNVFYKACPQPECNKKVVDQQNGQYRCEKCGQDFTHFKYRLMLSLNAGDWTGSRWLTCFNDVAEALLGRTAQEVGEAIEGGAGGAEPAANAAEALFAPVAFRSFAMKLRNKLEFYGDSSRIKSTVVSLTPINHKEYNTMLIKSLEKLTGITEQS